MANWNIPYQRSHLPSGYVKIAIENDPIEIVDFRIQHGGSFPSGFCKRLPEGKWDHRPMGDVFVRPWLILSA
jgi:hypothetical protein